MSAETDRGASVAEKPGPDSPEVIRVTVAGGIREGAGVIRRLQGGLVRPADYSIVPGTMDGTVDVTLTVPPIARERAMIGQPTDVRQMLDRMNLAEPIADVSLSARHHLRMIAGLEHPDAVLLLDTIRKLGGHVQGAEGDQLKLTADPKVCGTILSFCRARAGIVLRGRANTVFSTIERDHPTVDGNIGVTASPQFAPNATRHVLVFRCWIPLQHDIEIIEMLEGFGLRVSSVGSRPLERDDLYQILTIQTHDGSDAQVQKALAAGISLPGVDDARQVAEEDTFQYVQASVPYSQRSALTALSFQHKRFYPRKRLTDDFQVVSSGSLTLKEAAALRRDLVGGGITHRANAVAGTGYGGPVAVPADKLSGIMDPDEAAEYRESLRMMLASLVKGEEKVR